jgi:gliding motility-associated-like protein
MYRKLIIFSLVIYSFGFLKGQSGSISNPCARILTGLGQDSITWSALPCSNFDGYIIYSSLDTLSPLVPIDTVTNPAQLGFVNSNTSETARFYRVSLLCGGVIVSSSTIVRNTRPITPNIRSVSIINNQPVLSWYPSPSTEVIGYQIYKENPYGSGNFFPYPANNQLVNSLSFADVNSSSLLVRYALLAVSNCNSGLLGEGNALDGTTGPHSSISLDVSIDSCSRVINLDWNDYENWSDGVDFYIIYRSISGAAAQAIDTVFSSNYVYPNAQNGDQLEFYIEAKEKNQNNSALSNSVQILVNVNREMDYLYLINVSIDTSSNRPEVTWKWDIDTDFGSAQIQRKLEIESNWQSIYIIPNLGTETNTYIDLSAESDTKKYDYRIQFTDLCGNSISSNIGSNILLRARAGNDFVNFINWSELDISYAVANQYNLFKNLPSNTSRIANLSSTQLTYQDQINVRVNEEGNSCYFIVTDATVNLPNGFSSYIQTRSNRVCVKQDAILWFPNAFVPDGKNSIFKPLVALGYTLKSYNLQVYDRYGAIVFETNDINSSWDGTKSNQLMPQGVYIYIARFTQDDGTEDEQTGTVTLIR